MNVTVKSLRVASCDGVHSLAGTLYIPDGEIKGFVHVLHGMIEYMAKYERIMTEIAEAGWLCFGYDHLGHGNTVNSKDELGYIAERGGWDLLCRDVRVFADRVIEEYSNGQDLPYVLMGHSMGSFIARIAAQKYIKPHKLIIMGTGKEHPAVDAGLALIGGVKLFYGGHHVSQLLYKLVFGNFNGSFDDTADAPGAWLTSDVEHRKRFSSDPLCSYKFSTAAMSDLLRLLKHSNSREWYKKLDKSIPVLLVSGKLDPVGGYGKGIDKIFQRLKKHGFKAECKIYEDGRHEIFNDTCRHELREDILNFIN